MSRASFEVRPARPAERFVVVGLARRFHAVSGLPFEFNPAHASAAAQSFIEAPERLCLVLDVDGALRGVLGAAWSVSPLAPVRIADEVMFWIDPAFRGHPAPAMLSAYEQWARAQGCAAIGLSALNDPRVTRFFRAKGFDLVEQKFLKMVI